MSARAKSKETQVAQRGGGQFGGQPNMQQLMKQAQKMQEQLEAAQAELAEKGKHAGVGIGLFSGAV